MLEAFVDVPPPGEEVLAVSIGGRVFPVPSFAAFVPVAEKQGFVQTHKWKNFGLTLTFWTFQKTFHRDRWMQLLSLMTSFEEVFENTIGEKVIDDYEIKVDIQLNWNGFDVIKEKFRVAN